MTYLSGPRFIMRVIEGSFITTANRHPDKRSGNYTYMVLDQAYCCAVVWQRRGEDYASNQHVHRSTLHRQAVERCAELNERHAS